MKWIKNQRIFENSKKAEQEFAEFKKGYYKRTGKNDKYLKELVTNYDRIKDALNKNPNYLLLFTDIYISLVADGVINKEEAADNLVSFIEKIKTYKNLLKSKNINILDISKETEKDYIEGNERLYNNFYLELLEHLEDLVENTIIENENKKFTHKFISNKYKHLVNDDTYKLMGKVRETLKKGGYSDEDIYNEISSIKFAAYNNAEDFNNVLEKIISKLDSNIIYNIIKSSDGAIVEYDDDSILIVRCDTYDAMEKLGSPYWCRNIL